MLDCVLGTTDEISKCVVNVRDWIHFGKPFIEAGLGLLGVGSIVSISVMTWFLRKARQDIELHMATESALRSATADASKAREASEERERASRRSLLLALEELDRRKAPIDEQVSSLQADNERLTNKFALLRSSSGGDGAEFWARNADPSRRMPDYETRLRNSIPIMLFANQKGGVGKTTLSTNLAAYFASLGEKVLVVDLDYQGSATSLMLAQAGQRLDEFPSMVDVLFADELNELWGGTAIQTAAENLDYVSCWYSFEKLERRLEYDWALNDSDADVRYRLARALLSPQVQNTYKRVIIDAPPRMTTGFINGMCASTHLFVPTVVDYVSTAAVGTFAAQFKKIRDAANPIIDFSAVIGTMTSQQAVPNIAGTIVAAINRRAGRALNTQKNYFLENATMVRTQKIAYSTEEGIAYLRSDQKTRDMFRVIGESVAQKAPLRRT